MSTIRISREALQKVGQHRSASERACRGYQEALSLVNGVEFDELVAWFTEDRRTGDPEELFRDRLLNSPLYGWVTEFELYDEETVWAGDISWDTDDEYEELAERFQEYLENDEHVPNWIPFWESFRLGILDAADFLASTANAS